MEPTYISNPSERYGRGNWPHACGDFLGSVSSFAVTAAVRVIQLPFVALSFICGEVTDSFLRASDVVGESVGLEAGKFAGRLVGTIAVIGVNIIEFGGSKLYSAASSAFSSAVSGAKGLFRNERSSTGGGGDYPDATVSGLPASGEPYEYDG